MSVVVPAYNAEKYIAEALNSLQAQTLDDFEAIIVNDGSTDSTQTIIDGFCSADSRFISIIQQNSGVSAARNKALERASGKYVAFLDSDDVFTEDSLRALYEALEETGADMAVCRLRSFGVGIEKYNPYAELLASKKDISAFDFDLVWNYLIGNKCFRREAVEKSSIRFPPLRYSEDGAFIYSVMLPSGRATGVFGACYKYRRHDAGDASVTQTVNAGLVRDYKEAMNMIYKMAESAVSHAPLDVKMEDFLQELTYKSDFALITQFFRLFWQADDNALRLIGDEHKRLQRIMRDDLKKKSAAQWADIGEPVFSRRELAYSPFISVIVSGLTGDSLKATVESVFLQSMPRFELLISKSEATCGAIPQKWLDCENVIILPDNGFLKAAKSAARSKKVIILKNEYRADARIFKFVQNLGLPEIIKNRFFGLLVRVSQKAAEMKKI